VVNEKTDCIQFVLADIRRADWWGPCEGMFDLVMSATALHWLSAENLAQVYRHIYEALKPGGWLLNSDHVASDDPEMQARYRQILVEKQQAAFGAAGADNWDGFWQSLRRELEWPGVHETELWEGTDDGLPRQFHFKALQACGFEQVAVHWQDLGEAVVGARKMSGQ
jgi:SAM-dependent methyltransferase